MWMDEEEITPRFVIGDRDRKFPDEFDEFRKPGVRCIRISPRAPKANAFVESFIGSTKREMLNHFVCFSRGQLDYILRPKDRRQHSLQERTRRHPQELLPRRPSPYPTRPSSFPLYRRKSRSISMLPHHLFTISSRSEIFILLYSTKIVIMIVMRSPWIYSRSPQQ